MAEEESISAPPVAPSPGALQEQVAVVSGATGAIGGAFARRLAGAGADLLLLGRRQEVLERLATELDSCVGKVEILAGDLTQEVAIEAVRDRALAVFGGVDLLVHSLGVFRAGSIEQAPVRDLDLQWEVNVRAPYLLTQRLLPSLLERRGQIVFVNSNAGLSSRPTVAAYAASKHALKALADGLRDEVNDTGVRVLTVFPGRTASEMQRLVATHFRQEYRPDDLMTADDVARPVVDALALPRTVD